MTGPCVHCWRVRPGTALPEHPIPVPLSPAAPPCLALLRSTCPGDTLKAAAWFVMTANWNSPDTYQHSSAMETTAQVTQGTAEQKQSGPTRTL